LRGCLGEKNECPVRLFRYRDWCPWRTSIVKWIEGTAGPRKARLRESAAPLERGHKFSSFWSFT
jgi:hypothetical protein